MCEVKLTRREQQRIQTVCDIKDEALKLLASGPVESVTLSAVARGLRMSVAGLYRYFDSRDDLLAALAGDSYQDFADALDEAGRNSDGAQRLDQVVTAYRAWALAQPGRYRLMFSSAWGSGLVNPDVTLPGADRAMAVLVEAVVQARDATERSMSPAPLDRVPHLLDPALVAQLTAWAKRTHLPSSSPDVLWHAVTTWTRLHGIVSLEIERVWSAMALDPNFLVASELHALAASTTAAASTSKQSTRKQPTPRQPTPKRSMPVTSSRHATATD